MPDQDNTILAPLNNTVSDSPRTLPGPKRITGSIISATVAATAGVLIGQDNKRIALTIFPNSVNRITISDNPSVALDGGINIPAGGGWFQLTYATHGDLVKKRLSAIAAAGGTAIGLIEAREEGE